MTKMPERYGDGDSQRAEEESRLSNVMQMWRNGALTRSLTGAKSVVSILCERVDLLTDNNMKKLCYIEELRDRSLWKTLKDWWRWRRS